MNVKNIDINDVNFIINDKRISDLVSSGNANKALVINSTGNGLNVFGLMEALSAKVDTDQYASTTEAGLVKVGNGLSVEEDGTLNADAQELTPATETNLGGIKVGDGLSVTSDGTLSALTGTAMAGVFNTKASLNNLQVTDLPNGALAKVVTDESNQNKPTWYKLRKYQGWYWDEHEYQTSTAGRKFARHPSGMGTVMSMNDGTDRNILVLDAQYRTTVNTIDFRLMEQVELDLPNPFTTSSGPIDTTAKNINKKTDAFLNTEYVTYGGSGKFYSIDQNTSKTNTTNIIEAYASKGLDDTNTPVRWCRNQLVDGVGCDLPNMNVLSRIEAEHTMLDNMDVTLSDYPDNGVSANQDAHYLMMCSTYGGYNSQNHHYGFAALSDTPTEIIYDVCSKGSNSYYSGKVTIPILELPNGDGAEWEKVVDEPKATFASLTDSPQDNTLLATALNSKASPTGTNFNGAEVVKNNGSTTTIKLSNGRLFTSTASALTLPTPVAGVTITVKSTANSITWGGSIKWADGTAPELPGDGKEWLVTFVAFDTNYWFGVYGGGGFATVS